VFRPLGDDAAQRAESTRVKSDGEQRLEQRYVLWLGPGEKNLSGHHRFTSAASLATEQLAPPRASYPRTERSLAGTSSLFLGGVRACVCVWGEEKGDRGDGGN